MSRNDKIRQVADAMPVTSQAKNGVPLTDGYGHPLTVNHFRVMKEIEKKEGKDGVARYINNLFKQEEERLREEHRLAEKRKATEMWINIISGTILLLSFIGGMIWLNNR